MFFSFLKNLTVSVFRLYSWRIFYWISGSGLTVFSFSPLKMWFHNLLPPLFLVRSQRSFESLLLVWNVCFSLLLSRLSSLVISSLTIMYVSVFFLCIHLVGVCQDPWFSTFISFTKFGGVWPSFYHPHFVKSAQSIYQFQILFQF